MANLGYVGLGDMGGGMVKRLLAAGRTVTGHNRTKAKAEPFIEMGMKWANSPREVAESADIIFSMVTNTKAVQAVTQGPDGILAGLTPDKIYVDMSTMSPDYSRELAAQFWPKPALKCSTRRYRAVPLPWSRARLPLWLAVIRPPLTR